ncbi:uncharacterized protein [Euphorbia lathyris]|uniref:uncharacterized protein isoform X2 n=1 Tax=Euphorbia lathyris TaxID=212925 RepID=UPI00331316F6
MCFHDPITINVSRIQFKSTEVIGLKDLIAQNKLLSSVKIPWISERIDLEKFLIILLIQYIYSMNWLRKKKEKQRNEDEDSIYTGFATAVAAAAFAVRARDAKTQPSMAELPHSNQINNRFSFKKMTTGAQTLSRKATSENEKTADEVKESELKSQRQKLAGMESLNLLLIGELQRSSKEKAKRLKISSNLATKRCCITYLSYLGIGAFHLLPFSTY